MSAAGNVSKLVKYVERFFFIGSDVPIAANMNFPRFVAVVPFFCQVCDGKVCTCPAKLPSCTGATWDYACGSVDDNCGGQLDCGACTGGLTCQTVGALRQACRAPPVQSSTTSVEVTSSASMVSAGVARIVVALLFVLGAWWQ
jgi:hypothetical protein